MLLLSIFVAALASAAAARDGADDLSAADRRQAFLAVIARPKVPLSPITRRLPTVGDTRWEHVSIVVEAGERATAIVAANAAGDRPRPAVVVLHGTGSNKDSQRALLTRLAGLGFVAVAMDGRHHGERNRTPHKDRDAYVAAILAAHRVGTRKSLPFLYDTAWDVMRLLDYLGTRPDVDAARIGLTGFSKGGMEAVLIAAADPRVAAVAPLIGVQSFRFALDHDVWHSRVSTFQAAVDGAAKDAGLAVDAAFVRRFYDRVVPGVYSRFDGPAMLPLIAPRPLMIVNGDRDDRTPRAGLDLCIKAATDAFDRAHAASRLSVLIQDDTGHEVKPAAIDAVLAFFRSWLHK